MRVRDAGRSSRVCELTELSDVRRCAGCLRRGAEMAKGSIGAAATGEVRDALDTSTSAERRRLTLPDDALLGSARGPRGMRVETLSCAADGVGAVTMTFVGPVIMTLMLFVFVCVAAGVSTGGSWWMQMAAGS